LIFHGIKPGSPIKTLGDDNFASGSGLKTNGCIKAAQRGPLKMDGKAACA